MKRQQRRFSPQYPGRLGLVVRACSIDPAEYRYVLLLPTQRAQAREILANVTDMEPYEEGAW
jgi:hypothetical protein